MRLLVVVVALVGCGDTAPSELPATLTIAASTGTIENSFTATIAGSANLGAVAITSDTGTIALDGDVGQAALYNTEQFSGFTIFGSVVVAPDRWSIAYPYCMNGALADVYAEPVGPGGFTLLAASGSCASAATPTATAVDLPGVTLAAPTGVGGETVHGDQIELDGGVGQIALGGEMLPAVVFDTVDCSTTCGAPGWYELHTLIWDEASAAATFVIVYLELDTPDSVQLSYALRLPTLDDPFHDAVYASTWTAPTARALDVEPLHLPLPRRR